MVDIIRLTHEQWEDLRDIRLTALLDSPRAFLHKHKEERKYSPDRWQAEFGRGDWYVGLVDDERVSLVGTTRLPTTPADQCYLEYLWVSPDCRRKSVASEMITGVLGRLRTAGLRTAFLWVLDGNAAATELYKSLGFVSTNYRQPLPDEVNRSEELMELDLSNGLPGVSGT